MTAEYCYRQALQIGHECRYTEFCGTTSTEFSPFLIECPDVSQRSALDAAEFAVRTLTISPGSQSVWKAPGAAVEKLLRVKMRP